MTLETFNQLVAYSTLGSQILIFFILISLFVLKKSDNTFMTFIKNNAIPAAFIVALLATLGSLYYSEVIEFTPCKLCWIQRIFLFPQVLLLGFAYYKDDKNIVDYSILLSIIGLLIALFQYYGQITGASITDCTAGGSAVSCNVQYVTYFGYITIPLMSVTTFGLITSILLAAKKSRHAMHSFRQ